MFGVRLRVIMLDLRAQHIAADESGGIRQREIGEHDAIDPAGGVAVGAHQAQSHLVVDQRQVKHAVDRVVETSALGLRGRGRSRGVEGLGIRLVGDELDRAAHRARPIQRALGSAQHFDPVEVIQAKDR
jgi:hypothetical protein